MSPSGASSSTLRKNCSVACSSSCARRRLFCWASSSSAWSRVCSSSSCVPQVALEHLQAQRHAREQLLDQGLLPRAERAEGGDLDHGQQRVARRERPGHRLRRRGPAQARRDAQVVRRQAREVHGLAFARALAGQPLPEPDRVLRSGGLRQAVVGDAPQARLAGFQGVEGRHPAAQRRHQPREQPFAELGEGRRPLQVAREGRHVAT